MTPLARPRQPSSRRLGMMAGGTVVMVMLVLGGMHWWHPVDRTAELPVMKRFAETYRLKRFAGRPLMLKVLLDCHEEFLGRKPERAPRIAIVDLKGLPTQVGRRHEVPPSEVVQRLATITPSDSGARATLSAGW